MTQKEYIEKVYKNVRAMRDRTMQTCIKAKEEKCDTIEQQLKQSQDVLIFGARTMAFQEVLDMMREIKDDESQDKTE